MSRLTTLKDFEGFSLTCEDCGKKFNSLERWAARCPSCKEQRIDFARIRDAELAKQNLEVGWLGLCPPLFLHTVSKLLPNQKAFNQALAWRYGQKGLILHGKTGTGKSRTAWEILRIQYFEGRKPSIVNSSSALQFASMFIHDSQQVAQWITSNCNAAILLMDDVFKVKLTEAFEAALFSIVDRRLEKELPIIATTNDIGETLSQRMSGDRAEPFIRRLRESCTAIQF